MKFLVIALVFSIGTISKAEGLLGNQAVRGTPEVTVSADGATSEEADANCQSKVTSTVHTLKAAGFTVLTSDLCRGISLGTNRTEATISFIR